MKALNVWVSILGMRNHIELLQKISPRQRQDHPPKQMERQRLPIKTPFPASLERHDTVRVWKRVAARFVRSAMMKVMGIRRFQTE